MARTLSFARPSLVSSAAIVAVLAAAAMLLGAMVRASAQAKDVPLIRLSNAQNQYAIAPYLEILRDATGKLTIQDVSSPAFEDRFTLNQQGVPSLGVTSDAVWVRFRLRDDATAGTSWLLALDEPRQGRVDLYLPASNGTYLEKRTGRDLPFYTRDVPNREFVFRLDPPQGADEAIYLRLASNSPMIFPLTIWTADAFALQTQTDLLVYGLFYGAMLIMAGYNLFLAISLGDLSYLYLSLFIVFYSLNQAARDGLGQQYLYPGLSNRWGSEFSSVLMMMFLILFSTRLLETRSRVQTLHRALLAIIIIFPIWFVLALFIPMNTLGLVLILTTLILLGIAGFLVLRQGYGPARLYLVSWFLFFFASFLFILSGLRPLKNLYVPDKPVMVTVSLAALMGSLALADRVHLLKSQAEAANDELARSEAQYRSLFDNSRDGIFITTMEGEFIDVNAAGLRMIGISEADLSHVKATDLYTDPVDLAGLLKALDERGSVEDYPAHIRRQDGTPLVVLVSATMGTQNPGGRVVVQGEVRDITEQQRLERELADGQVRMVEAVAQERGRLARELHDSVTQALYSIGLYANAAARALKVEKKDLGAEHVGQIIQLQLEAMVDMRSLIFELRPPLLEKVGLSGAIEMRLRSVEERTGTAVEFHSDGNDGLPLSIQTELYRIAQEALNNVTKHSRAKKVVVSLKYGGDRVTLEIQDDGDGFDVESTRPKNTMGLRSMAERAQSINATVRIESTPGHGTLVCVEVPNV